MACCRSSVASVTQWSSPPKGNRASAACDIMASIASRLSSVYAKFLGRDECRVIIVGLDGSGKTTIVYRLKHGKLQDSQIIRAHPASPHQTPHCLRNCTLSPRA